MAKGGGKTRGVTRGNGYVWDGNTDEQAILSASIDVFKREARTGLGNFDRKLPKQVSDSEYEKMLKSGDYIEVYHSGTAYSNRQMLTGSYYYPNEVHIYGPGYYFATSKDSHWLSRNSESEIVTGLISKKEMISRSALADDVQKGIRKYVSPDVIRNANKYDLSDVYSVSAAAGKRGAKALAGEGKYNHVVIIDRSALIVKK